MTAKSKLNDIVKNGITIDLLEAEKAMAILDLIGDRAEDINKATFGEFFGGLQVMLGNYIVLRVGKFFEPYSTRNEVRSIPSALELLQNSADQLVVEQRDTLIRQLLKRGVVIPGGADTADEDINNILVGYFRNRIPTNKKLPAVENLFNSRDKSVAHNQVIAVSGPTFVELKHLIALAQEFVILVGPAYLSMFYSGDSDQYYLTSDAKRSSRCLARILKVAGI